MAKWLDKYENGGEYLGTTNVGRNYSPAWGGQFQMGGNIQPPMAGANQTLPMYQMGGYVYPTTFVPQAQKGKKQSLQFLPTMEEFQPSLSATPRVNLIGIPGNQLIAIPNVNFEARPTETLSLNASVNAPMMISRRGVQGLGENSAFNYNIGAGYQLGENDYLGLNYGNNQGTNVTYRHTLGNRKKKKAEAGASIPGSVGFTYARTGSTPSEGPYAKKTLPSAQTGYSSKPFEMVWKENAPSKKSTNNVERYEPSNAVKNAKSTLAVASLAGSSNPVTQYLAQIAGGTGDLYTSARYAMDKNWGKAGEDFVQGALGFIPYSKAIQGMKGDYFTKGAQFFNKWLKRAHAASDVKTLSESPKNTKLPRHENGGSMSFYQHGLDWTPRNISKNGSVVKDNMGYWNPDNWGKVVEIDSPNITMQGVNQDLIGISDEGDVQYMEPGKDYKFKGKKVKEYPVAKNGVNQQDEKTAQHLDQLLNFTNYNKPTKGGWLDKY